VWQLLRRRAGVRLDRARRHRRIAAFLKVTPEEMVERYCRKVGGRWSLNEGKGPGSDWDCVFLREEKVARPDPETGEEITLARRYCSVYSVRPLQCRTWPFWRENLTSRRVWDHSAVRCHGMNYGDRRFTREQIEAVRDAEQWPAHPPTSSPEAIGQGDPAQANVERRAAR
jgi:Fe-S-cluster containining protein